jgi:hypothetical protein
MGIKRKAGFYSFNFKIVQKVCRQKTFTKGVILEKFQSLYAIISINFTLGFFSNDLKISYAHSDKTEHFQAFCKNLNLFLL